MTEKQKQYVWKLGKTFIQGALGFLITILLEGGKVDAKSIICGFFAAGLSAIMNIKDLKPENIEVEDKSEEEFESE